jgi:hypothetical protein
MMGWQWFLAERDENDNKIVFGYVRGFGDDLGDIWIPDMKSANAKKDEDFKPMTLDEINDKYPNTSI